MLNLLKQSYLNCSSYFIKKDSNIWVFGAVRGEKYMDNAKYLFEYVNSHTAINAVWLSNNSDLIDNLNQKGYKAFKMDSKDAIYYALHAKVAIVTHRGTNNNADLPFYCFTKKTKIIQLWHGIALKKIAFDDKVDGFTQDESSSKYKIKQKIKQIFFPYKNYINTPSLVLALSDESKNTFAKAFRVDKKNVAITGYPRNDILLKNKTKQTDGIKKIIYMPTFRNKSTINFDTEQLSRFLNKKDLEFYIKLHPFDKISHETKKKIDKSKNIFILELDDIYETLATFDLLITDYSSIYFDYLLLDKPIIFAPFDKQTYLKNEREFYYDYDKVTTAPQAKNWIELINYIDNFVENPNLFSDERKQLKNKFHKYQDSNASKRVVATILELNNR